ncbi:hypothetical protein, conserved [Babesia ovata]|uniref:Uncharacterized protein n=1 Tax=Babesia ovata TaxID=189622 RepID=A0A2H6KFM2_9APIC|nr:uncharacterized protein BOVATA_032840 [Babesia ovata]GBE61791.1 hypothetical protein, conserved [Babesia ovata]
MVYNSLTEAPRNLKEGIDWLMAVKGTNIMKTSKAMGAALHKFLGIVKLISMEFLEQEELKDQKFVKKVLEMINGSTDRKPGDFAKTMGSNPDAVAQNLRYVVDGCEKFLNHIKNPDQYKSAYSPEVTWDASCSASPEDCAAVFVGMAPMLYAGLLSLWDAGRSNPLKWLKRNKKSLAEVLKAVGYDEPECRTPITASNVINSLRNVDKESLDRLYNLAGF